MAEPLVSVPSQSTRWAPLLRPQAAALPSAWASLPKQQAAAWGTGGRRAQVGDAQGGSRGLLPPDHLGLSGQGRALSQEGASWQGTWARAGWHSNPGCRVCNKPIGGWSEECRNISLPSYSFIFAQQSPLRLWDALCLFPGGPTPILLHMSMHLRSSVPTPGPTPFRLHPSGSRGAAGGGER